jgi:hypothetical protein
MYVVLAFALMLIPLGALFVLERMAATGKGPLANSDGMVLLDGTILPVLAPVATPVCLPVDPPMPEPEPIDDEACATESRLVAALIAGELNREQYRERMADLATSDAAVHPVRLPPARPGT